MRKSSRVKGIALIALCCLVAGIWYAIIRETRGGVLTVSFLPVGTGDAIFIDAPSGRRVLIDGGPNGSILRVLGEVLPPWDRTLDVLVVSSPDSSEAGGLVDVLQRYAIHTVLQTGVENTSADWNLFEKETVASGAKVVTARRGQLFDLGGGASLQILFPDRSAPDVANQDGCVVARLTFGTTSFLFSCIASTGVQNYLAMLDRETLHADVIAIGAGEVLSPVFLGVSSPSYVVGCAASTSTQELVTKIQAQLLDTCSKTVVFVSDGKTVVRK